jgi:hypothetical protein
MNLRKAPSRGIRFPLRIEQPVSAGLKTPGRIPRALKQQARPPATKVFPTPVSVPVMKSPFGSAAMMYLSQVLLLLDYPLFFCHEEM